MNKLKDFPKSLQHKIIITFLIGAGCFVFRIAYWLFARDRIFLFLSGAVLVFSIYRGLSLYRIVSQGKYETVEGTCVSVTPKFLGKQFTIKIMDDEGIETSLRVNKQTKVKIGDRYRFFFKQGERSPLGSAFFDSMTASDMFLGYESAAANTTSNV